MTEKEKTKGESKVKGEKIAVLRIRGKLRVRKEIIDTMDMLKLYKQNYVVFVNKTDSILGMIKKIKDYVTWGEISSEVLKQVEEKRGEKDPKDNKKLKKYFRLHPPIKGFERKGIKKPFNLGGALGYRGEKINDLIKRML